MRQAPFEMWKKRDEVRRLVISRKVLGAGSYGGVCFGRLYFKDGTSKRVAVKIFDEPLSDEHVRRYEEVIARLSKVGARIPKTGFVKHGQYYPGWVQVQQLFARVGKSKFADEDLSNNWFRLYARQQLNAEKFLFALPECAEQFALVTKAGLRLHLDCVQFVQAQGRALPYVMDFDLLMRGNIPTEDRRGYEAEEVGRPSAELIVNNAGEFIRAVPAAFREKALEQYFRHLKDVPEAKALHEKVRTKYLLKK